MKLLAENLLGPAITAPTKYGNVSSGAVSAFFSNILRLIFVVAGIYAFINFIIAGYQYMSAGGDAKALQAAWSRIWQSLLGLAIVVISFALASLISLIMFGDPKFILNPAIYGPGN